MSRAETYKQPPRTTSQEGLCRFIQNLCHELLGLPVPIWFHDSLNGLPFPSISGVEIADLPSPPSSETWMDLVFDDGNTPSESELFRVRVGSQLGHHFPKVWESIRGTLQSETLFKGVSAPEDLPKLALSFGSPLEAPIADQQGEHPTWPSDFWTDQYEALYLWGSSKASETTLIGVGVSGYGLVLLDSVRSL